MKILRTELTAEGRADILQQVMAYRGGYSQDVRIQQPGINIYLTYFSARIAARSRPRLSQGTYLVLLLQTLWN